MMPPALPGPRILVGGVDREIDYATRPLDLFRRGIVEVKAAHTTALSAYLELPWVAMRWEYVLASSRRESVFRCACDLCIARRA